ncbi:MAG TPA: CoA-binding protein [Amycolatopsis sp.]|uniref:CoA-binding protein n=1 Tax=Amycolatopsis sp. TaxID=37632 RepID=UPI002B46B483|nr:CoA-binding protein [Amycolatopsis sp.]HKS46944.1 CoA-binding protein [Amycolatopsis sp.]
MTDLAEHVLTAANTIAVVGLSRDPGKAAHAVPASLQAAGFRIIPVHPSADELLGEKVYRSLTDIPEPVDLVDVFRPPVEAPEIARQAVAIGAKTLWLQQGIVSAEARRIAEEGGLDYVEDRCTAVVRALGRITKKEDHQEVSPTQGPPRG